MKPLLLCRSIVFLTAVCYAGPAGQTKPATTAPSGSDAKEVQTTLPSNEPIRMRRLVLIGTGHVDDSPQGAVEITIRMARRTANGT